MNRIVQDWRQMHHGFIPINHNIKIDALLFPDGLVVLVSTEDDLQHSVHNLHSLCIVLENKFGLILGTHFRARYTW